MQAPPPHTSGAVQVLPSLQGAVLLVCTQPDAGLQLSSVQTLPSVERGGGPPVEAPPPPVCWVVDALPSSHGSVFGAFTHPDAGLQLSSVQTLPSLQFGGGPPLHVPPPQVSPVVQALPSSHGTVLLVFTHPDAGLQLSSVQPL